ncbi:MAG: hypothetical protein U1E96_03805 [Azonexus sp.]
MNQPQPLLARQFGQGRATGNRGRHAALEEGIIDSFFGGEGRSEPGSGISGL